MTCDFVTMVDIVVVVRHVIYIFMKPCMFIFKLLTFTFEVFRPLKANKLIKPSTVE